MHRPTTKNKQFKKTIFSEEVTKDESEKIGQIIIVGIGTLAHLKTSLSDYVPTSILSMPLLEFINLKKKRMLNDLLSVIDIGKNLTIIFDSAESLYNTPYCISSRRNYVYGLGKFVQDGFKKKISWCLMKIKKKLNTERIFKTILWHTNQRLYCCEIHGLIPNPYTQFMKELEKKTLHVHNSSNQSLSNLMTMIHVLYHGGQLFHRYNLYQSYKLGAKKPALRMAPETFYLKIDSFERDLRKDREFEFHNTIRYKNDTSRFCMYYDTEMFDRFQNNYENTGSAN